MNSNLLSVDELLTTTRAVRKRLNFNRTVPLDLIRECLTMALQAPSGSNSQGWHFVVVDDPKLRKGLAELYLRGWNKYLQMPGSLKQSADSPSEIDKATPHAAQMKRVLTSAQYLADHLEQVPVHIVPCVQGRTDQMTGDYANAIHAATYGSIMPATWNYMLAARSRGLGTAWTSAHLIYEKEAAELLGIPYAKYMQIGLIPTAYYRGDTFNPALRKPLDTVMHHNAW